MGLIGFLLLFTLPLALKALPQVRFSDDHNIDSDDKAYGKSCLLRDFIMKTKKQSFETTMKKVPSKSPLILKIRPNEYFNFLPRDIFRRKQFRFSLPMTDELNQLITSGGQPPTEPPKYYDYNPLMKYRLQFVSNDLMTFLKKGRVKVQMIFTTTTQHTIIPTTSSTTPLNTGIATDDFEIDNNLVDKSFDRAYKY